MAIIKDRGASFRKLSIPPIYGRPRKQNVDFPQSIPSNMWLVRLDSLGDEQEKLRIQTVPIEMSVTPESNWVAIPTIGRNNPFYNYTGGEDTLEFILDWYSTSEDNTDVINKCRWVESLSKANGYVKGPPKILLIFGKLFTRTTWIIEKAPYKLSLFNKSEGMLPRQAYQELTLKKVTDHNSSITEIRYLS